MKAKDFKKLTEHSKHSIVWKIVKGDLKVDCKDKSKSLTKKQYKKILNMEG